MKVVIIEDEAPAFRRLQKILEEQSEDIEIVEVIDSVADSVKWIRNHELPDLIFMDIQLSDGISFEIFDEAEVTCPVIFTTAFDEYMLKAFKVNSIDYLLKPIKNEDLAMSLEKFNAMKKSFGGNSNHEHLPDLLKQIRLDDKKYKTRFLIKQGDKLWAVEAKNISYFHLRHGVVHLITNDNKKYIMDQTLDELIGVLDPEQFFRANRQFIVAFGGVKMVHRYHKGKLLLELSPACDEETIVSAEKASEFKNWMDS